MGTQLQWFSFAIPFRLYDPFFPFPFRWIPKEKKLIAKLISERQSNQLIKWVWLGPSLLNVTCCLYAFQILKLFHLDKKERQGLEFYIPLLGAFLQFFLSGLYSQFATYYTKNAMEMGVLFTNSHKAMVDGITRFNGWHLYPRIPIYKDILGVAFCALTLLPAFTSLCVPLAGLWFGTDPLGPILPHLQTVRFYWVVPISLIRVTFYMLETMVTARWACFVCVHLAMVLSIGNIGLMFLLKLICERKPRFLQRPLAWERLLIEVIVVQRRVFLHTQIWSQNIGSLIFTIYVLGIGFWCSSNYSLITLREVLNIILTIIFITVSGVALLAFFVLVPFVSHIAINSKKLNRKIVSELKCYKLGSRYAKTLRIAMISTPFFTFSGNNFTNLFGIPFEVTMNLVLTFPVTLK
ncbi:unnamed protein product [Orchesella dallaii]|uniref:Odorant receptor n=1 Tax=Orchesella dallaii TaxID=48710 RepID=A0ABP1PZH6_9HEXA